MKKKGSEQSNIILQRTHKKNALLQLIRQHQQLSRYDLVNLTRLSNSTVWSLVTELMEEGLVVESGIGDSKGGRPPLLLEINPAAGYIVGMDFDGNRVRTVVVNFKAEVIYASRRGLNGLEGRNEILKELVNCVNEAVAKSAIKLESIMGIGIAAPGLINVETGCCRYYPNLPDWRDVPLKDVFEFEFGIPVYIENNSQATALGERIFGAGQKAKDLICIVSRTGIGAGIIINGQPYYGVNFTAGELGHITIDRNGQRCRCGKRGCLETLAATPAILKRAAKILEAQESASLLGNKIHSAPDALELEMIWEAAAAGDPVARAVVLETGEYLGEGIVNVINLLNPEMIILAGDLLGGGALLLDSVKKTAKELALDASLQNVTIVYAQLKENAGAIGAATVVLQQKFNSFLEPI